jgi:hypothetical protein
MEELDQTEGLVDLSKNDMDNFNKNALKGDKKNRIKGDNVYYENDDEYDDKLAYDVDEYPPWFVTITSAFQVRTSFMLPRIIKSIIYRITV